MPPYVALGGANIMVINFNQAASRASDAKEDLDWAE